MESVGWMIARSAGSGTAPQESPFTFSRVLAQADAGLTLFAGPTAVSRLALPFCAPFLIQGETVFVVDGANSFDLYRLTEWARRKQLPTPALLNRLRVARAFTCFQMATILHHIGSEMESHRATRLVLTGLPDCLYDEELSRQEARHTFARCLESLVRLATHLTVLVFSDWPTHPVGERIRFFDSLVAQARAVFEVNNTEPVRFVPIKAPGLLTVGKGKGSNGKNSAHR